ncbi:hypothetical protein [Clostridium cadaveris]|uniref:hypothetical protein n=1 Tax=Clostridium cadaveris TaxID=1529 RepID=UPI000C081DFC|nr:hypothetical protein [Clostridium cadaveris]NWK12559.1 hypothetical protein [Clostridium cadaveris]
MDKAWYINGTEKEKIIAYKINQAEYVGKYKGHLYCCIDGCNAEMVFVEQDKKDFLRFFRRLSGSKHNDGCPYKDGNNIFGISGTTGTGVARGLGIEHAKNILDDTYKIATNTKKPRTPSTKKGNNGQKKVDPDKEKKNVENTTTLPKTDESKNGNGSGTVHVHRKDVASFLISKNKRTYSVYGDIVEICLKDDESYITITNDGKKLLKICFRGAFKTNYEAEYRALKFLEIYNDMCKKNGKTVKCTCICFREEISNEIIGDVLEEDKIRFDNKGIWAIWGLINR